MRKVVRNSIFVGVVMILLVILFQDDMRFKMWEKKMLERRDSDDTKVYLLILDAADPDIIEYLIENDQLPNFKRMKDEGYYSRLESFATKHPANNEYEYIISLPIIATIFTGVSPEEHGMKYHIYWTEGPDLYYAFKDIPVPTIWDVSNEHGKTVGIVGTQGNIPIERIDGFIISGEYILKKVLQKDPIAKKFKQFPDSKLLFPNYLKVALPQHIDSRFGGFEYDFSPEIEAIYIEAFEKQLNNSQDRVALRLATDIAKSNMSAYYTFGVDYYGMRLSEDYYQMYRPDLMIEYEPGIDFFSTQYNFFEYIDYKDMKNVLFEHYRLHDEHIGYIIRDLRANDVLIVASDHGIMNQTNLNDFHPSRAKKLHGIMFQYSRELELDRIENPTVYDVAPLVLGYLE